MTAAIRGREAQVFGGLVVPGVRPGFKVSGSDLFEFLRGRLREGANGGAAVYTVYVRDPGGNYNAVVAHAYPAVGAVPPGEVFVYVPRGPFAVFTPNGEYSDPVEDVWAQAEIATAAGEIERAYAEEIEVWHDPGRIELFISIEL